MWNGNLKIIRSCSGTFTGGSYALPRASERGHKVPRENNLADWAAKEAAKGMFIMPLVPVLDLSQFDPEYFNICRMISLFFIVKYSCLHFHPTTPHHSHLPPLVLSICPLYMFLDGPSPTIPYYPSHPSTLVTVNLFFISMSLVAFCFLDCFID